MPPGRPPKRASDGSEGLESDSPSGAKPKQARIERGPEDFSSVVKNKLQSYTRTGQACDRCKVGFNSVTPPFYLSMVSGSEDACVCVAEADSDLYLSHRFAKSDAMLFPKDALTALTRTSTALLPTESQGAPSVGDTCNSLNARR